MKKYYLSHLSAAKLWNVPNIDTVIDRRSNIGDDKVEVTVPQNSVRFRTGRKMIHSCELDLPASAIVSRNGEMVASPELLFLEFASELSIHRLILLGLQLCSHKHGKPYEAITTKEKLESFLANTAGHRGQRKAIRAVKYVKNGSASIMESLMYMVLTLPYALGGYGLNGAVFNYRVELNSEARKLLYKNCCYPDLYYKKERIAVEYDSYTHHSSPMEQGKDSIRADALAAQGIQVIKMNTIQLYDRDACRLFAHNLAARLNKRINIRTKSFDKMHVHLRELLPTAKPVLKAENS
ncbi:MAG: hypothetical protein GX279_00350 [Clostridiaceae bacterium]|jgi:hypothetical protein|nr:hypothetical protein [Clostridiaceae bacterium]